MDDGLLELRFGDGRLCPVWIAAGAVERLENLWNPTWRESALVADHNVMAVHGDRVAELLQRLTGRVVRVSFPPGERNKSRTTKAAIEDRLLDEGLDRNCCVVALGGGISLDVAGFVAATYMRGVAHLAIPTSLLAQVDAAVGGKTAVNTRHGKNLVGAFHQPAGVIVDPDLLATLPAGQWPDGLAEMVKHAVIADRELFNWLEQHADDLATARAIQEEPLRRCVRIKANVVQHDEREHGLRSVLNFGHTVGHALEATSGGTLSHGRAVALGMLVEGRLACRIAGLSTSELRRLRRLIERLGLDSNLPGLGFDELVPYLFADKKRRNATIRVALPSNIGVMAAADRGYTLPATLHELQRAWEGRIGT